MRHLVIAAIAVLGLAAGPACAERDMSRDMQRRIDNFVNQRMAVGHVPGLSLVIVIDGRPVYTRGYGFADLDTRRPMTERTLVGVGSTAKSLTALAVMQLVEQGRVDLDAPVTRYLPWFRTADGLHELITVRHLLSHSAGLPKHVLWDRDNAPDAMERLGRRLADVHLNAPPGTRFEYANDGFVLAGLIVQAVSGMHFEDYMKEHVLLPLGMHETGYDVTALREGELVQGYVWTRGELRPTPLTFSRGQSAAGAAFFTSARDVGRYLSALVRRGGARGRRVISAASLEEMWTPQVLPDDQYGLGWEVRTSEDGQRSIEHAGDLFVSGSQFLLDPEEGLAVATLANTDGEAMKEIARGVMALLRGHAPPPPFQVPERAPSTYVPDPATLAPYVGSYITAEGPAEVYVDGHRLMVRILAAEPAIDVELEAYGENDFVLRNDLAVFEGFPVSFAPLPDGSLGMRFFGELVFGVRLP